MTTEERIESLEKEIEKIKQREMNTWAVFQQLLGVKMVANGDNSVALMILMPKKDQGKPGTLADMFWKLDKLWLQYGEAGVILPDVDQ